MIVRQIKWKELLVVEKSKETEPRFRRMFLETRRRGFQ